MCLITTKTFAIQSSRQILQQTNPFNSDLTDLTLINIFRQEVKELKPGKRNMKIDNIVEEDATEMKPYLVAFII